MKGWGYRCHWTHPNQRDHFIGEFWPDHTTAEYIADMLRTGGMLDVQIKRWPVP